jgi:hypothetical protein
VRKQKLEIEGTNLFSATASGRMRRGSAFLCSHERRIAVPNTRGQFTRNAPTRTPFVGLITVAGGTGFRCSGETCADEVSGVAEWLRLIVSG